jgi:hypothetical protein
MEFSEGKLLKKLGANELSAQISSYSIGFWKV